MTLFDQIKGQLDVFIAKVGELTADGLTWNGFLSLMSEAYEVIVGIVEQLPDSGVAKKSVALEGVDYFYDTVIKPIDLPGVNNWIERKFVDPAIGRLVHDLADTAIDKIVAQFNAEDTWPRK